MKKIWYADEAAKQLHAQLRAEMAPSMVRLCPGYELSHVGINRSDYGDEVRIVLHLNPIGQVKAAPTPAERQDKWDRLGGLHMP